MKRACKACVGKQTRARQAPDGAGPPGRSPGGEKGQAGSRGMPASTPTHSATLGACYDVSATGALSWRRGKRPRRPPPSSWPHASGPRPVPHAACVRTAISLPPGLQPPVPNQRDLAHAPNRCLGTLPVVALGRCPVGREASVPNTLNTPLWATRRPPPGTLGPDGGGAEGGSPAPAPGLSPDSMTAIPARASSRSLPCILRTAAQRPLKSLTERSPVASSAPQAGTWGSAQTRLSSSAHAPA